MKILALDIALRTGVCHDGPDDRPILSNHRLPTYLGKNDLGPRIKHFVSWLHDLVRVVKPQLIGVEAPLNPRWTSDNIAVARLLISLAGAAQYVAACHGIKVEERAVDDVRRYFVGSSRVGRDYRGRKLDPKEPVMARCRQLGWQYRTDDEADAAALWAMLKAQNCSTWNFRTLPLGRIEELRQ